MKIFKIVLAILIFLLSSYYFLSLSHQGIQWNLFGLFLVGVINILFSILLRKLLLKQSREFKPESNFLAISISSFLFAWIFSHSILGTKFSLAYIVSAFFAALWLYVDRVKNRS